MELPICPTCQQPLTHVQAEQHTVEEPGGLWMITRGTGKWDCFCGGCFGDISERVFREAAEIIKDAPKKGRSIPYDPNPASRRTLLTVVEGEDEEHYWRRVSRAHRLVPPDIRF